MTAPVQGPQPVPDRAHPFSGLLTARWPEPQRPPHPAPTEPCRRVEPDDLPRAARAIVEKRAPGWQIVATRSVGHRHLARDPWFDPDPVESFALRARGRVTGTDALAVIGAWGVWIVRDGASGPRAAFDSAWTWPVCTLGPRECIGCAGRPEDDRDHPAGPAIRLDARGLRALLTTGPVGRRP